MQPWSKHSPWTLIPDSRTLSPNPPCRQVRDTHEADLPRQLLDARGEAEELAVRAVKAKAVYNAQVGGWCVCVG